MNQTRKRVMSILLVLFVLIGSVPGMTLTAYAATSVSDEAELKAALEAGGEIELSNDIEMVETERITVAKDATIDLKGHTLKLANTYNPLGVDAKKTLEFKGPGVVESVNTFGPSVKGDLVVSGSAEMKLTAGNLGDGSLTVTGNGSKLSTTSGFLGSGSVTITENATMECAGKLICKTITISGGANVKATDIYSGSRGGSVVITGTGTTIDAYSTNGIAIGGNNSKGTSISISNGATVNNASYLGHYQTVTIDGAIVNGRETGYIAIGSPITIKGDAVLTNVNSIQETVAIGDTSSVTFLGTSSESFKSIKNLTFTGTPTLNNMGTVSLYYYGDGVYLYQDAGAVFNLRDGVEGLDVSLSNGTDTMIYIKDQKSGLLPGIVRYEGDVLPRDFAVYEGKLQRDTADFTSYHNDEKIETLESGEDKLMMATPVCKIERNGSTIKYYTIHDAFADALLGETIVLLCDVTYSDSIVLDPAISDGVNEYTLDLAGFGITQESSLPYDNDHIPFVVYSGMTLNLTDSSEKQTGYITVYDYEYPLFFNAGTINIDRGTYFGIICGASYNGSDIDGENYYQSIGSDGIYVFKEAYIIHAKDKESQDEHDAYYPIGELSYITFAEGYGIDEEFEPGDSPAGLSVKTHITKPDIYVTFDANGGDGTMEKQKIESGTPTALTANAFTLTESAFTGWNTETDGSGTAYDDEEEVTLDASIILYAQWEEETTTAAITVTFDANGGDGTMEKQEIEAGTPTALTANAFTLTGSAFTGWNTETDGSGTAYDDEEEVTLDASITLYAQWEEEGEETEEVTLTYDPNGGTVDGQEKPLTEAYPKGTEVELKSAVRDEWNFLNWNTKEDGSGSSYLGGASLALDESVILYAQWTQEKVYHITFKTDAEDEGTVEDLIAGDKITAPEAPEKEGLIFVEWGDLPDTMPEEDLDIKALWRPDPKATDETKAKKNDGKISGVTDEMEYSADGGKTWTAVSGTEVTGLAPGEYQVRFAEAGEYKSQEPTTVTIAKGKSGGGGGGGSSSSTSEYNVTIDPVDNGTVKADKSKAAKGYTVTITATPNNGYKLDSIKVIGPDGEELPVTKNPDGTYSFKQPAGKVTVKTAFTPAAASPQESGVADLLITEQHVRFINGYPDGTVRPEGNITRAETATMFYNLLKDKNVAITVSFGDVEDGAWYSEAVGVMASLGIVKGYPNGTFKPDQNITRAEFATMATLFAKSIDSGKTFSDVPSGHWAMSNIAEAAEYGWVIGYPDGTFKPSSAITRAEAVTIVDLMLGRSADKDFVDANLSSLIQFSDLKDASKWYFYSMHEAINEHDFVKEGAAEIWK